MKGSAFYGKSNQSPLNKALVGKQGNLPEHLKAEIEAAPSKMYDSPAKHRLTKQVPNKVDFDRLPKNYPKTHSVELKHTHPENEKKGDSIKIDGGGIILSEKRDEKAAPGKMYDSPAKQSTRSNNPGDNGSGQQYPKRKKRDQPKTFGESPAKHRMTQRVSKDTNKYGEVTHKHPENEKKGDKISIPGQNAYSISKGKKKSPVKGKFIDALKKGEFKKAGKVLSHEVKGIGAGAKEMFTDDYGHMSGSKGTRMGREYDRAKNKSIKKSKRDDAAKTK